MILMYEHANANNYTQIILDTSEAFLALDGHEEIMWTQILPSVHDYVYNSLLGGNQWHFQILGQL